MAGEMLQPMYDPHWSKDTQGDCSLWGTWAEKEEASKKEGRKKRKKMVRNNKQQQENVMN